MFQGNPPNKLPKPPPGQNRLKIKFYLPEEKPGVVLSLKVGLIMPCPILLKHPIFPGFACLVSMA
jgi:hypothetical protein